MTRTRPGKKIELNQKLRKKDLKTIFLITSEETPWRIKLWEKSGHQTRRFKAQKLSRETDYIHVLQETQSYRRGVRFVDFTFQKRIHWPWVCWAPKVCWGQHGLTSWSAFLSGDNNRLLTLNEAAIMHLDEISFKYVPWWGMVTRKKIK